MDDAALAEPVWCGAGGSAGDRPALASRWVQNVLALEIAVALGIERNSGMDRGDLANLTALP
jgi:hypothetical protein